MNLNKKMLSRLMLVLMLALGLTSAACAAPSPPTWENPTTWDFTLHVSVTSDMVTKYGGLTGVRAKVDQQLVTVNQHYAGFDKPIRWIVKDLVVYSGSALTQAQLGTNGANYSLTYTEQPVPENGGWRPWIYSIIINWLPTDGGVFGQYGASSLIHELGHARGGIDMYGLRVDGVNNPVNGAAYVPPASWMNLWYLPEQQLWDQYTRNIVNASATTVYNDDRVVMNSLPATYRVKVVNSSGNLVPNATVSVYPVDWFAYKVTPTAIMAGTSATNGLWTLPSDPFGPSLSAPKWHLWRPLVLVTASVGTQKGYAWLSLPDAGNAYFANPTAPFQLTVVVG